MLYRVPLNRQTRSGLKPQRMMQARHHSRRPFLAVAGILVLTALAARAQTNRFDFGAAGAEAGYIEVGATTTWSTNAGYGWLSTNGLQLRDRGISNSLYRDFIFNNSGTAASGVTFRVSGLTPGSRQLLKVTCGDANYGDHTIAVSVPGTSNIPTMTPAKAVYAQLSATVNATTSGIVEVTFRSPTTNWVVNALTLEPWATNVSASISNIVLDPSRWTESVFATNPTQNLIDGFDGGRGSSFAATGLTRSDYLRIITGEIDFWKTKQNASGAIIDPYAGSEVQYSTPAFAHAAATLVVYAGRTNLLEPAALAMDWASAALKAGTAANGHDDFYPGMLAHAYTLLRPLVSTNRAATWASNFNFDPYAVYNYAAGSFNWNVVASSGEAVLQRLGLRSPTNNFVIESWAGQGQYFNSAYGLYLEGPMAYDHFPRLWMEDALAQGYTNAYSANVARAMDRAAVTSLFMQSPWGELPAGGRSAHHQWNEAEQCVTYEIYAGKAKAAGNLLMAAAYKRGAHLALSSMFRWVRATGEMQVLKNWVDPSSRHAYETYSYHSQYNLLPMAMLSMAYEYAAASEDVGEGPSPADTGGYVFQEPNLHKVFANAGGTYVELDTSGDHHYDATGLVRVHRKGVPPQIGPSDSLLSASSYTSANPSTTTTGVGVSWKDSGGTWRTLGSMTPASVTVTPLAQQPSRVTFDVTYSGGLTNATSVTEHYTVMPDRVELTTEVAGYSGPLRYVWPVLATDGRTQSTIGVTGNTVAVTQGGSVAQTFTAPGADAVRVEGTNYSNHNGWARLGVAEFTNGGAVTMQIGAAAPSMGALADQTLQPDTNSAPISIAVADLDSPLDSLSLAGSASDAGLIPPGNIAFGGAGGSRTAVITPAAGARGTTAVTLSVSDGSSAASRTFNVTVLPQSQVWRQWNFGASAGDPAVASDTADPDGDGIPNFLERALGGNPLAAEAGVLPSAAPLGAAGFSILYRRSKSATDLAYEVQESASLAPGSWSPAQGTSAEAGDLGDARLIRFTAPMGDASKKYLRVKVTSP